MNKHVVALLAVTTIVLASLLAVSPVKAATYYAEMPPYEDKWTLKNMGPPSDAPQESRAEGFLATGKMGVYGSWTGIYEVGNAFGHVKMWKRVWLPAKTIYIDCSWKLKGLYFSKFFTAIRFSLSIFIEESLNTPEPIFERDLYSFYKDDAYWFEGDVDEAPPPESYPVTISEAGYYNVGASLFGAVAGLDGLVDFYSEEGGAEGAWVSMKLRYTCAVYWDRSGYGTINVELPDRTMHLHDCLPITTFHYAGTPASITATPDLHYCFDHWELDGVTNYTDNLELVLYEDHTLKAYFSWINNAPNTPSLTGPNSGYVGETYTYTARATDPDGDSVKYTFYWGDGYTTTTGFYKSGDYVSRSKSWGSAGTYSVYVKATDYYGAYKYSYTLTVTISSVNHPPNTPSQPSGPTICYVYSTSSYPCTSYSYTVSAVDPDGDNISYTFQFWTWPPTTMEDSITVGPYASGANATVSYVWTRPGRHCVAVYATDSYGLSSGYGYGTLVNVLQNDDGTGGDAGHTFANATVYNPAYGAGTLYPSLDNPEDWYQFYAQSGQKISAWLSSTGGANFDLQLYDNNTVLKASSTSTSSYDYINFIADSNGFWRIRIYNVTGEGLYYFGVSVYTPSPPGGCPILYTYNGTDYVCEGLLDIHNPEGIDVVYEYTLVTMPKQVNGAYLFRLVEHPQTISHIDQVKLYAILEDGPLKELPLIYAWHSEDGNVLPQLLHSDEWKADTLGADHNNGTSQSIDLKFASLSPNLEIVGFVFEIEGNNRIAKR